MRPVSHAHRIRAAPDAGDLHQRSGDDRAQPSSSLRNPSSEAQDSGSRAVGHDADIQTGQRPGDHGGVAHVLDRVAVPLLRIGVVVSVDVVLDAHRRHLLDRGAKLFHVAGDHHGIVAGIEAAHRVIKRYVRSQGDKFVAFPGFHMAHGLETVRDADIHVPAGDRFPGFLKTDATGCAAAFHAVARFGRQPEVILGHNAGHQLAGEMIGEVGSDRAIHDLGEMLGNRVGYRSGRNHRLL